MQYLQQNAITAVNNNKVFIFQRLIFSFLFLLPDIFCRMAIQSEEERFFYTEGLVRNLIPLNIINVTLILMKSLPRQNVRKINPINYIPIRDNDNIFDYTKSRFRLVQIFHTACLNFVGT